MSQICAYSAQLGGDSETDKVDAGRAEKEDNAKKMAEEIQKLMKQGRAVTLGNILGNMELNKNG